VDLKPLEKLVLLALIEHAPNIQPGMQRLANLTGLSERGVIGVIGKLESKGVLRVERSSGARSRYFLALDQCVAETTEPGAGVDSTHAPRAGDPCTACRGTHAPRAGVPMNGVHAKQTNKADNKADKQAGLSARERAHIHLHDPVRARFELGDPGQEPSVRRLLALWSEVWGVTLEVRGGLHDTATRAILERLDDGHPMGELESAIRGSKKDDWIARKRKLQSPAHVFRDPNAVRQYSLLEGGAEDVPAEELTGWAKMRAEALTGSQGPRARELAMKIKDPAEWFLAVKGEA
jgi:hypothetical protein